MVWYGMIWYGMAWHDMVCLQGNQQVDMLYRNLATLLFIHRSTYQDNHVTYSSIILPTICCSWLRCNGRYALFVESKRSKERKGKEKLLKKLLGLAPLRCCCLFGSFIGITYPSTCSCSRICRCCYCTICRYIVTYVWIWISLIESMRQEWDRDGTGTRAGRRWVGGGREEGEEGVRKGRREGGSGGGRISLVALVTNIW
jgi:hypothetical protein